MCRLNSLPRIVLVNLGSENFALIAGNPDEKNLGKR